MENNPVMQRVTMLTEMWKDAVTTNKDIRVFSWVGTSSVDYRMIRGFVMFHTSEKSTLSDLFFSLNQPFEKDTMYGYGEKLISDMGGFLDAWNKDKTLVDKTGAINWAPSLRSYAPTDEAYFTDNINRLADSFFLRGDPGVLAVALLPQTVADYGELTQWIGSCIASGISEHVRFMVYDTYELKAFEEIERKFPSRFMSLYPDMDMPGAMNQILENAKAQKKDPAERDAVSYQQSLLKMNEAISYDLHKNIEMYKNECIQLSVKNNWPHLEALTYFFIHGYFANQHMKAEALTAIDKAIEKSDLAIEKKIVEPGGLKYQYRIAKANFFFSEKKYSEAADIYKECLQLDRTGVDKFVILGIYQMLGNSMKNAYSYQTAWAVFEEGWKILDHEDAGKLKNNAIAMFYARDMLDTAPGNNENADGYYEFTKRCWGADWLQKINRNEYNPVLS